MRGGQDNKAVGEGGGQVDMQNCSYRGAHKVMMMTHKVMMLTMTHKLIVCILIVKFMTTSMI